MMTMQQQVEAGWRRISQLENESEDRLQVIRDLEEERDDQQIKIDNLEEEVERLKDLLTSYKGEAAALRQDNEELQAKVKRLEHMPAIPLARGMPVDLNDPQGFGYALRVVGQKYAVIDPASSWWQITDRWIDDMTTDEDRVVLAKALKEASS